MKHDTAIRRLLPLALVLSLVLALLPSMAVPAMAAAPPQIMIMPNNYVSTPDDDAAKEDPELQKKLAERFYAYQIFSGQIDEKGYNPGHDINQLSDVQWGASIKNDESVRKALSDALGGNLTLAVDLGITFELMLEAKETYLDAKNLEAYKDAYNDKNNWVPRTENGDGVVGGTPNPAGKQKLEAAFNEDLQNLTIGNVFTAAFKKNVGAEIRTDGAYTASRVLADFTPAGGNIELARSFYAIVFDRDVFSNGQQGDYKYLKEEPVMKSTWISGNGGTSYWSIGVMTDTDGDGKTDTRTLKDGYYMIWDAYEETGNEGRANASYMAAVYGYGTIELKSEAPGVTKTIAGAGGNGAGRELGTTVSFTLTGSLPENYFTAYRGYPYIFEDTMDPGLDYIDITRVYIRVPDVNGRLGYSGAKYDFYVVDEFKGTGANQGRGYRFKEETIDGKARITVSFPNLHNLKGKRVQAAESWDTDEQAVDIPVNGDSRIIVEYTAKLNETANYTNPYTGNQNTVVLRYANDPLWDPAANTTGGTWDAAWEEAPKGKSTDIVYLYDFGVHLKVEDKDEEPIAGAGFALKKSVYDYGLGKNVDYYAVLHRVEDEADPTGETPYTYYLAAWVAKDALGDLSKRDWGAVLEAGEIDGFEVLAADSYYMAVTTQSDGIVRVVGLEDKISYTLEEVVAPEGYDAVEDITVSFNSSYNGSGVLESLTASVSGGVEADIPILNRGNYVEPYEELVVRLIVDNEPGPFIDTGGAGTTLFYIGGGALLAGAALLLIFSNLQKKKKPK